MTGRKNDVLIIEDSKAITLLLRDFLKKLGYENVKYVITERLEYNYSLILKKTESDQ